MTTVLAYSLATALLAIIAPTTVRTSTAHLAPRAPLHPVLAWPLRPRGSLPLRALSLEMRLFVFRIYPIVVGRLHLDIGDIVVGHFLLDGFDMLDQPVWAPDGGHGGGDITAARVSSDEVNTLGLGGNNWNFFQVGGDASTTAADRLWFIH
jgi:hypothetical protein